MNPLLRRYRRWQFHRIMAKHAAGTARALAVVAQTNPTLASVTWQRVDELYAKAEPTAKGLLETVDGVSKLVSAALIAEKRRRGLG